MDRTVETAGRCAVTGSPTLSENIGDPEKMGQPEFISKAKFHKLQLYPS